MTIETPYRIKDAARVIGVCEGTILRWLKIGVLSGTKIAHSTFIPASEIRRIVGAPQTAPAIDYKTRAAGGDN